jgi:hypothetical protein
MTIFISAIIAAVLVYIVTMLNGIYSMLKQQATDAAANVAFYSVLLTAMTKAMVDPAANPQQSPTAKP